MIIISSRKFRDNQNEILRSALTEEVILTTVHYGNFRLVPLGHEDASYARPTVPQDRPAAAAAPVAAVAPVSEERPVAAADPVIPAAPAPEPVAPAEEAPITETYSTSETEDKPHGEVYVDPSLLTLEEFYKQEGIEVPAKKKGLFGKMFGK